MKSYLLFSLFLIFGITATSAIDHTINIVGLTYSPATLEVQVGDNVTIKATPSHPTAQVSETTWQSNGTTELPGGWGSNTSEFTFTVTNLNTIFYVCQNHVGDGMKGRIIVSPPTGVDEAQNKIGFSILNNPVRNQLHYTMHENQFSFKTISIYDTAGKKMTDIQLEAANGNILLDFLPGQYFYILRSKEDELLVTGQLIVIN